MLPKIFNSYNCILVVNKYKINEAKENCASLFSQKLGMLLA